MSTLVGTADLRVWAAACEWLSEDPDALTLMAHATTGPWLTAGPLQRRGNVTLVLSKMAELRARVGVLKAKKKDGVRFKVRSADELVDKIRPAAHDLGLLIYPVYASGKGHVVEDGTLAEVQLTLRIQAVGDGSFIDVAGFGLGADNQDKAGGKAGTYAFKTALIQALLAGGAEDTDDSSDPIPGGVRRKSQAPVAPSITREEVEGAIAEARAGKDIDKLKGALARAKGLSATDQAALAETFRAASADIRG